MTSLIGYYSPLDRVFDRAFGSILPAVNGDAGANGRALKLDVVETPRAGTASSCSPTTTSAPRARSAACGASAGWC